MKEVPPHPGGGQAAVLTAAGLAIIGAAFLRGLGRSVSAHAPELMVIARDAAAAVLTLLAVTVALMAARTVARHEGRHCEPPAPQQPPRPAWTQRPGEPAYTYRLRPQDEPAAPATADLSTGPGRQP